MIDFQEILTWIAEMGAVGALPYVLLYIVATVLFIPGSVITLAAGVLFGVGWGSVYVSLASTIGAAAAFLIGRYVARDAVSNALSRYPSFAAVDTAVAKEGFKVVLLTRLSPLFPFNFLNYAFGITTVSFREYVLASWVGMMPGTVLYVYIGSLAGSVASLAAGMEQRARTPIEWAYYILGLTATVVVTVYVTRIAKQALHEQLAEESGERHEHS